jgi:ABC-2 type transport system ATP-binding protein
VSVCVGEFTSIEAICVGGLKGEVVMSDLLAVRGLTKKFGDFTAVDGIDFSVSRGEVLGFLGPNGAGKTTAMRMVTGFLPPSSGTVSVGEFDVKTHPIEVKRRVGYLPEGAPLYDDMTPQELLTFAADVRNIERSSRKAAIESAAERINIGHVMHQPIGTLSKGYKRRVGIAQAILHDPDVLILDEPTDGLDPNQKHEVRNLINEMSADKVIVISTHILEEVDVVCSRAIVIASGKIVADGKPRDLEAQSVFHNAVSLRLKAVSDDLLSRLGSLPGVEKTETSEIGNGEFSVTIFPGSGATILGTVSDFLKASEVIPEQIHVERGRMDEVFRRITTNSAR